MVPASTTTLPGRSPGQNCCEGPTGSRLTQPWNGRRNSRSLLLIRSFSSRREAGMHNAPQPLMRISLKEKGWSTSTGLSKPGRKRPRLHSGSDWRQTLAN